MTKDINRKHLDVWQADCCIFTNLPLALPGFPVSYLDYPVSFEAGTGLETKFSFKGY